MAMAESVQSIAERCPSSIPVRFIRPESERPDLTHDAFLGQADDLFPVIDMSQEHDQVVRRVGDACRNWGFFQVINHGVDEMLVQSIRKAAQLFFQRPMSEKLNYSGTPGEMAAEGYGNRMLTKDDQILDWRDYLNHHTLPLWRRNPSNWPHQAPHRKDLEQYSFEMLALQKRLLAVVSESLGLRPTYIEDAICEPFQNVVMNYYPPCPQPDLTLGLQSHSDFGAITLLLEDDIGGLQVRKDDKWFAVKPLHNSFIANLGDQVEILSNGRYKSVEHRVVVNSKKPRFAIAAFYDPSKDIRVSPALDLIDKEHPRLYKDVVFRDHVSNFYSKGPEGKRNLDYITM